MTRTIAADIANRYRNMGYSLAWIAVRGIGFDEALNRQGLEPTATRSGYAESDLSAIPWGEWILIVARRCDARLVEEANLARLSAGCEVIFCEVEEHVMFSSSALWRDGSRCWRIEHDAQESIDHLVAEGALPDDYDATRSQYAEMQRAEGGNEADVDYLFEIPLRLAQARVGFKHDEVMDPPTNGKFVVLLDRQAQLAAAAKRWWQFWK